VIEVHLPRFEAVAAIGTRTLPDDSEELPALGLPLRDTLNLRGPIAGVIGRVVGALVANRSHDQE